MSIIAFALTPFLPPFLNSAIWRARYAAGRPARLEDSGGPSPVGRWQRAQARAGFLPAETISGIGGCSSGNPAGGFEPSSISPWVYFFALPGLLFWPAFVRGAALGVA